MPVSQAAASRPADELFSVRDRVIVVTGGLGQLGRQYSLTLAERGARVAVFDIAGETSGQSGTELHGRPNLRLFRADVTDRSSLELGLERVCELWGTPYGLINNAAIDSPPGAHVQENGPFETYPSSSWDRVMEVNLKGVFQCCQILGGAMAEFGSGSIVNICSIYGVVSPDQRLYDYRREQGPPFFKPAAYAASKSALLNLTRYLATYWAPRGVRVNTLTLGGVLNDQDATFRAGYCQRVPLGRMAREDEYNGAILFLLSQASAYMTGANLVIDGGFTAW